MMTVTTELIALAKDVLRIDPADTDYDAEISFWLNAGLLNLGVAGVVVPTEADDLIKAALMVYLQMNFGEPSDPDRLMQVYNMYRGELSHATGYTDWRGVDG